MGWNEADNKLKKKIDKAFVSCEESYERNTIREVIKEEFPNLTDGVIDSAIAYCCSSISAPRPRDKFMQCLRQRLGIK